MNGNKRGDGIVNTQAWDGSLAGGGEILQFWGNNYTYNKNSPYLDNELISQFEMIGTVKFIIFALIIFAMILVVLKIFNIRSPFKGKGITKELDYMEKIRKRDESILRANHTIQNITKMVESTPFKLSKSKEEYWQYNLNRANVKIPGGSRIIKAKEFNAMINFAAFWGICMSIFVTVFINTFLGVVLILAVIICSSTMPMMMIRGTVQEKDLEIKEHFSDYYLMLHYVLIANANTPLNGVMKSYAKTTSSVEMQRYVDSCLHYIDTYGEYEATRYIAKDYREIPEVGKLMRLIRQANEGGEIEAELLGFRTELLNAKKYAIERRMGKLIARAKASFNLLMPVLFQAVLSAMAIYISDLGAISSIVGGLAG